MRQLSAAIALPTRAGYPHEAVVAGLRRCGVADAPEREADLLVTWTPWRDSPRGLMAETFAKAGRPIIVMENGWLSPIRGEAFYQLALDGWNGQGRFWFDGPERWRGWRVEVLPWRRAGSHVLVLGQHGHPSDRRNSPRGWARDLPIPTPRPIVRRRKGDPTPLAEHLAGAHVAVTWSSNAASHAIVAGVPVLYAGPYLMVAALAGRYLPDPAVIETPPMPEREPELERLAWAQWTADELATGEPFRRLLERL